MPEKDKEKFELFSHVVEKKEVGKPWYSLIKVLIAKTPEIIKEKSKLLIGAFKGREISESWYFILIILTAVLILGIVIVVIKVALPKTSLEIEISGPETAEVGELVTYTVTCKNTGNVTLENPELVFNYPAHSLPEKGELIERMRSSEFKDFIYPKEEEVFYFKTRLFGVEGEKTESKCWLNYKTKSTSSIQTSQVSTFSTQISEVPIDLELDIPSKIPISSERQNEFKFGVRYLSFIDYSLSNLKLKIDYPSTFNLKESKPEKVEENQWEIPTLAKNETGEVELLGNFPKEQEIGKELNFGAQLSIPIYGEEVLLKETIKSTLTYKPVFLISQKINGQEEYSPSPDERLHYQIYFQNIEDKSLRDLVLISTLEGDLYDFSTIETPMGENKPGDNSIVWSGEKISKLKYLPPEGKGEVEFWVKLKPDYKPENISEINAVINNKISLGGFEKEFNNKINSKIEIEQEGYFKDVYGFFENSGPQPPQVNQPTNYTIVWKIKNYYNLVKNAVIKASFSPQAKIKSILPPSQGKIDIKGEYLEKAIYPGIPVDFRFEHNLSYKMQSTEVEYLQIVLKEEVPQVYPESVSVSGYFGQTTFNAVIKFQEKYKKEILEPQGLKIGTGYVDELTRLKLNELLIKGVTVTPNEISWTIERIEPGVGVLSDTLTAVFQISFTPVLAQKGKMVELVGEVTFSGKDQWTGEMISTKDEPIDTSLPDDPTVKQGEIR